MSHVAKIIKSGRRQAVRLPAAYRFDTKEVYVRRDDATGDVILSRRPPDLEEVSTAVDAAVDESADFLAERGDGARRRSANFPDDADLLARHERGELRDRGRPGATEATPGRASRDGAGGVVRHRS